MAEDRDNSWNWHYIAKSTHNRPKRVLLGPRHYPENRPNTAPAPIERFEKLCLIFYKFLSGVQ